MSFYILLSVLSIVIVSFGLILLLTVLILSFVCFTELAHVILSQPYVLVEPKFMHGLNNVISLDSVPLFALTNLIGFTRHEQNEFSDTLLHGLFSFFRDLSGVFASSFSIEILLTIIPQSFVVCLSLIFGLKTWIKERVFSLVLPFAVLPLFLWWVQSILHDSKYVCYR